MRAPHYLGLFVLIAIGYLLGIYWPGPGAMLRAKIG
jgi:hypothetical protein